MRATWFTFFFRKLRNRDIHGLSTHKVYPSRQSPAGIVGFYPAFSPVPWYPVMRPDRGGCFLWHCLSPGSLYPGSLPVRKYGALCCPDFPPRQRHGDRTNCCCYKYTIFPDTKISLLRSFGFSENARFLPRFRKLNLPGVHTRDSEQLSPVRAGYW